MMMMLVVEVKKQHQKYKIIIVALFEFLPRFLISRNTVVSASEFICLFATPFEENRPIYLASPTFKSVPFKERKLYYVSFM